MSGAVTAVAVGALAYSAYSANEQAQAQKSAQKKAERASAEQARLAERDFRRQNRKAPDLAAMLTGNAGAAEGGIGSTMLTGPAGVANDKLSLGKSTLLGG